MADDIVSHSQLKFFPCFELFQSCKIKDVYEPSPGLIVGLSLEMNYDIDLDLLFDLNNFHLEYLVYSESHNITSILNEEKEDIEPTKEKFYPNILRAQKPPLFNLGDVFSYPEDETENPTNGCICSCQWGELDCNDEFIPGWHYLVCWFEVSSDDKPLWDIDCQYSEANILKMLNTENTEKIS